jgi:hypothetical protein
MPWLTGDGDGSLAPPAADWLLPGAYPSPLVDLAGGRVTPHSPIFQPGVDDDQRLPRLLSDAESLAENFPEQT